MTDQDRNTHNPTSATEPLALRLSEGLGPLPEPHLHTAALAVMNAGWERGGHVYSADQMRAYALDAVQAEIDRLRKDAIKALAAGGVLIRLPRVEGYEEVCDELLAADAMEGINWPSYEVLTAEAKGTT